MLATIAMITPKSPAAASQPRLSTHQDCGPHLKVESPPRLLPSRWEAGCKMRFREWTWVDPNTCKRWWETELRNLGPGGGAYFYQGTKRERP